MLMTSLFKDELNEYNLGSITFFQS